MLDLHEAAAQAASNQAWEWEQRGEPDAPAEDDLAHQAAEKRGVKPNPDLVLTEDPRDDAADPGGQVHPVDPDQRAPDHQLVARLLLLLGTVDVRAAVRPRSLSRQPGHRRGRAGGAGGRRDDRHAGQRPDHRHDGAAGLRRGARVGPGAVLSRRGGAAHPGRSRQPPDAGAVVRRGRRVADLGREPAARRGAARHHAGRAMGARRERPDIPALARAGAGSARVRRACLS